MNKENTNSERRQYERAKANFLVVFRINKPLEVSITINKREVSALMMDLSQGGTAVVTEVDIPAKTIILMTFTLMNTSALRDEDKIKTMEITGEVRYNLPAPNAEHRLGIQFTKISPEDKAVILQFVNETKLSFPKS
tara:strand:- start:427 stop:837 length:411 start_codon:yes stop_codon:yes gene_type:complete